MSDSFTMLRSTFEALCAFPAEDMKRAFMMIGQYAMDNIDPAPEESVAFGLFCSVKPLLDKNKKKAEAGRIGGRSTQEHNGSKVQANLKQNRSTAEAEPKQIEAKVKSININTKEKEEKSKREEKEKGGRFKPPTPSDVSAYALEAGLSIDAERFVNFYASKGWLVGKSPMKDWKAAVRNWVRNDKDVPKRKPAGAFANFEERNYNYTELERLLNGGIP